MASPRRICRACIYICYVFLIGSYILKCFIGGHYSIIMPPDQVNRYGYLTCMSNLTAD